MIFAEPPIINELQTPSGVPDSNPAIIDWANELQTKSPLNVMPPGGFSMDAVKAWITANEGVVYVAAGTLLALALLNKR